MPGERPIVPGYDLAELIGVGASSTVWAATKVGAAELVALKIVAADAPGLEAAGREAQILSGLDPAHLVRLRDRVALPDGRVALALDLMAGGNLRGILAARGHLTPGECVTVLSPVAGVLGRLHAAGVVHADLSPGNILFDREGQPHLADLGSARLAGAADQDVRGTSGYLAPEVEAGAAPTAASDVYALGSLGWFMLTGSDPGPATLRGELTDVLAPELREHPLVAALTAALDRKAPGRPDADAFALAVFESARAQPLPLLSGRDDTSVLTHRIRAAQRKDEGTPWRLESRPSALGEGARPRRRRRARHAPDDADTHLSFRPRPRRVHPRLVAGLLLAAVLAALVVGPVWTGHGETPSTERGTTLTSTPTERPARLDRGADRIDHVAARNDRDAARERPLALVSELASARAAAWSSGRAARLVEVDAPGSPVLRRDTELLAEVQRAGGRYEGLTLRARDAALVSGGADRALVRASIDASAYRVHAQGATAHRPAVRGTPLLLELRWTTAGWRVHDVTAPE
jgi:hypothetical protein